MTINWKDLDDMLKTNVCQDNMQFFNSVLYEFHKFHRNRMFEKPSSSYDSVRIFIDTYTEMRIRKGVRKENKNIFNAYRVRHGMLPVDCNHPNPLEMSLKDDVDNFISALNYYFSNRLFSGYLV